VNGIVSRCHCDCDMPIPFSNRMDVSGEFSGLLSVHVPPFPASHAPAASLPSRFIQVTRVRWKTVCGVARKSVGRKSDPLPETPWGNKREPRGDKKTK
jgi:hypothetical protein